ncbi:hypothetical protein TrispH2_001643 [Trichoplax sp. H2]|nr:hypothetical protein TrispH2_001643 [Trichoplax sp. H2]|eukprot:RDD47024.1 hypothetical protein TrispH2_001643 [Trichoplax sp. H2]
MELLKKSTKVGLPTTMEQSTNNWTDINGELSYHPIIIYIRALLRIA